MSDNPPPVLPRLFLLGASLLFLTLSVRELFGRGGLVVARTIASNSGSNRKGSEETLLLYEYATKNLPPNATISVLKPNDRVQDHQLNRVAHGQLPYHRLVPQEQLLGDDAPDFVIAFDAPLSDGRYEQVYQSPAGSIWRRVRW